MPVEECVEECTKADEFIKEFSRKVPLSLDEAAAEFESELGCMIINADGFVIARTPEPVLFYILRKKGGFLKIKAYGKESIYKLGEVFDIEEPRKEQGDRYEPH